MKRAARHKTGSVVFDKRRKTWNFLTWEDGKRRSKAIGTVRQYPTKASAWGAAKAVQDSEVPAKVVGNTPTVSALVEQYRTEKMPRRVMTRQGYNTWLNRYIVPTWGNHTIQELEARPVDLWLQSLSLASKSKVHIRGLVRVLWDFAMWRGDVWETQFYLPVFGIFSKKSRVGDKTFKSIGDCGNGSNAGQGDTAM